MCNLFTPIMGPGIGVTPGNGTVIVKNVTANTLTAGMVVLLDLAQTDADVTSIAPGSTAGIFGCVIAVASAANSQFGQFFVVLETITAGSTGKVAPCGIVVANIIGNTLATAGSGAPMCVASHTNATIGSAGLYLQPAARNAATASTASQAGEKIVGYLLGATLSSTNALNAVSSSTQGTIWFNGIGAGFGQNAA